MYSLYTANRNYSSWSLRPWLLLRMLDIPFEDRVVPFAGSTHNTFREFSPTGMVPCLHDDEHVIWDSLGITLYVANQHNGVWPTAKAARAFAFSAVAEMHAGFAALRHDCTMNIGLRITPKPMRPALRADIGRLATLWEDALTRFEGPYLAGSTFSAVDAFFSPVVFRMQTYGFSVGPLAMAWGAKMLALPAMQEWQRAALSERWREPSHEADAAAAGVITADLRSV
jgi:glutathione S-transferase